MMALEDGSGEGAYTFSGDVRACFTNFFESNQLKAHYRNACLEVAKRVRDNPYVLGYDIMNEPSCGDIPNYAGQFENKFLKPLYEDVITAIRQVHPGAVGFRGTAHPGYVYVKVDTLSCRQPGLRAASV
jgi:hypothetical protein